MTALSQTTNKLRLGQMCTCNSYRNPAYLTKVASNIDVMSGGRLEYAIGAGWYDHEYKAYGYDYPTAGIRLKMLEESLIIYKLMTTERILYSKESFIKLMELLINLSHYKNHILLFGFVEVVKK